MAGTVDLLRRRAAGAAAMACCLALLAGCGGSSASSTTAAGVLSPMETARGPSDIAANLAWLAAKDHPELQDFKAVCPDEPTPPTFPVNCTMTAIDTSRPNKAGIPDGAHRPVSGRISVLGVYTPTRTYAYGLNYAPVHSK